MGTIATAPTPALEPTPRTLGTGSPIGHYTERDTGAVREIARLALADGSALLVDRLFGTHDHGRLLARLAADESRENAQILCSMYLADDNRGRCRPVTADDFDASPTAEAPDVCPPPDLRDDDGTLYRIRKVPPDGRFPELRWTRSSRAAGADQFETVRLRAVVARFETYEPARSITANALAAHRTDSTLSTRCLTAELARLLESPIVLNRRLREAVQARLARGDLTMSEIAMRCGRSKTGRRGDVSGETSWLGRRIGQLPEAGRAKPTPWVHSDVLALIARDGLGLSPNEVEL